MDSTFVKWIRQSNKLMIAIKKTPVKIYPDHCRRGLLVMELN